MPDNSSGQAAPPHYRPEIDGLRAVAVLPVVLYHYHVAPFSGGFVGVDIFFVISGFLITSLIKNDLSKNRFSIVSFYERRIRRIFPALFTILLVSLVCALALFFPNDLEHFGNSLLATIVFGSNFVFRNTAGYWDIASQHKPLLHTWSLAVEEQYYLLFPLVLMLSARFGERAERAVIFAILVTSLLFSAWTVRHNPNSAFYLLPSRAWELMIGAMLAGQPAPKSRPINEILCLSGLGLIAWAVFAFSSDTLFPGPAALIPCGGAAMIIYGGGGTTFVSNLLRTRLLRAVGLISYSLYLWHWIVLVFAKYWFFQSLSGTATALLIVLSFALATVSWRFIEAPFRDKKHFTRHQIFLLAALATVPLALAGILIVQSKGLPQRFPGNVQMLLAAEAPAANTAPKAYRCFAVAKPFDAESRNCRFGTPGVQPTFLLWGDSHAEMMLPLFAKAAIKAGRAGLLLTHNSCAPLLLVMQSRTKECLAFNSYAAAKAIADKDIGSVVLDARWAKVAMGTPYGNEDSGDGYLVDRQSEGSSLADNPAVFARGLDRLVRKLVSNGKHVTIIASVPEVGWDVPETLARIAMTGSRRDIRPTRAEFLSRQKFVFATFERLRARYGVTVVYPDSILCPSFRCTVALHGVSIYRDSHHLTYGGASLLDGIIAPVVAAH